MTKWVYRFGGGRGRGHGGDEGAAGRQGRQPRRDEQSRPAGAAGLHHHDRGLHLLLRQRPDLSGRSEAAGAKRRSRASSRSSAAGFGDPEQPAAGVGALGRARLDAGHDGHGAQPRPQRPDRRRASPRAPATRASPRTAIAASSRCMADVVLERRSLPFRGGRSRTRSRHSGCRARHRPRRRDDWPSWSPTYKARSSRRPPASRSRRIRTSSSGARSARCSAPGRRRARSPIAA